MALAIGFGKLILMSVFKHPFWKVVGLYNGSYTKFQWECDNYHLFTSHLHVLSKVTKKPLSVEEVNNYFYFYQNCLHSEMIMDRFPGRNQDTSQDEIIGANVIHFLNGRSTNHNPYIVYHK